MLFIWAVFGPPAFAHNLFVEPQTLLENPSQAPTEDDFSFAAPFLIDNVIDSRAIFSYLTPGDIDVFEFEVTPADVAFGPVFVSASALPPACQETRDHYPVTALMGPVPGFPQPPPASLPFEVPPGMGVIVADNPVIEEGGRPIFDLDTAEPELNLGIGWFLPLGLTQECLLINPFLCNFSNTIAQPVFAPGIYSIIMWNPDGKEQDYTANIGFSEENLIRSPEIEDLIRDNALLHTSCNENITFTAKVDQDSWLKEAAPFDNFGGEKELPAKNKSGDSERAVYRFDLSAISAQPNIISATARFRVTTPDNQPINVFRVTDAWTENNANWSNTGNNIDTSAISDSFTPRSDDSFVNVDLTSLVQDWVCGTPNHGLMFIATSNDEQSKYHSKEEDIASFRPSLDVVVGLGQSPCD